MKSKARQYEFEVSENGSDAVAFICIPKDFIFYKESRELYLEHLKITLEDYYTGEFDKETKEWFEKCKAEYGVTDEEIKEVKADIVALYKSKK